MLPPVHYALTELLIVAACIFSINNVSRNSYYFASEYQKFINKLIIVDTGPETIKKGTSNIRNFVQMDDQLDSVEEYGIS